MALLVSRSGLDAARAAFFEKLYRGRSVLCIGLGDGALPEILLARGAARVAGVDLDEAVVKAAQARVGAQATLKVGLLGEAAALGAPFDVVLVRRGETMLARDLWRDAARLVAPGGWLIAAALAGDRAEAPRGAMRFDQLHDHLAAYFPHVAMLAQAVFAGAAIIPFREGEVEPLLDTGLADEPVPALYVAVAGAEPLQAPYGLIQLPAEEAAAPAAVSPPTPMVTAAQPALAAAPTAESEELMRLEQAVEAAQAAALVHAEEMRRVDATLAERDSYIAELERDVRAIEESRKALQRASARADEAEARERAARRRVAELEGTLVRLSAEEGRPAPPSTASNDDADVAAAVARQVAELEARCAKLQEKADEAQRETWGHLKARSEAEAAAAEVREDTVRKLKDARKIANAELMRAMEEATRKVVTLKEELVRTERERNEGRVLLQAAQHELAEERTAMEERVHRAAAEEASRILALLEARLEQAEAERDRALKLVAASTPPSTPTRANPPLAASAAEMEQLLAGLDDGRGGEQERAVAVEEGLRRALRDLRSGDGGGEAGGNGGVGGS